MFPRCVCKSLYCHKCSPSLYVYSAYIPTTFFSGPDVPQRCSLISMLPILKFHSHVPLIPQKCIPFPMFPKHVSQSLCSPNMPRCSHDDVIKWKHFPRYWPFVRGIHRSPVNSPHKGQWRGALIFSLICIWINGWVNNREAGDLRRYRAIMTSV